MGIIIQKILHYGSVWSIWNSILINISLHIDSRTYSLEMPLQSSHHFESGARMNELHVTLWLPFNQTAISRLNSWARQPGYDSTRWGVREHCTIRMMHCCKQGPTTGNSSRLWIETNFAATLCKWHANLPKLKSISLTVTTYRRRRIARIFLWKCICFYDGIGCACVRCLPIKRRKSTNHVRLISCQCISSFVPFYAVTQRTMQPKCSTRATLY